MKPRFVIVNELERQHFEKYFELPYGYNSCPIFFSYDEALDHFENNLSQKDQLNSVIEQWDRVGKVDLVYFKNLPSEDEVDKYIMPTTSIKSNTIQ